MTNTPPLISCKNLFFTYPGGEKPVLSGLSFEQQQGELLCLLGSSGCGKTTLLSLAGGFLFPGKGEMLFRGTPIQKPGRNRIMVFQGYDQLFPWKTALGNVLFPMKPRDRARAEKLLQLTDLKEGKDLYPARLSGGMKQRAALARALAADPDMLLLDEPFEGLDAPTRRGLQQTLLSVRDTLGITIMMVTHDIREAVFLADRILLLSPRGELKGEFSPKTAHPRDPHSKELEKLYREIYSVLETPVTL